MPAPRPLSPWFKLIPALTASLRRLAPSGTSISFFSLTNLMMGMDRRSAGRT